MSSRMGMKLRIQGFKVEWDKTEDNTEAGVIPSLNLSLWILYSSELEIIMLVTLYITIPGTAVDIGFKSVLKDTNTISLIIGNRGDSIS